MTCPSPSASIGICLCATCVAQGAPDRLYGWLQWQVQHALALQKLPTVPYAAASQLAYPSTMAPLPSPTQKPSVGGSTIQAPARKLGMLLPVRPECLQRADHTDKTPAEAYLAPA